MIQRTVFLGILVAFACTPNDSVPDGLIVRDSAGVRITDSPVASGVADNWVFTQVPTLMVGKEDGADHDLLFQVSAAIRLTNGDVLISNSGSYDLRVFDEDGVWIRSFGRSGEGPGEFGRISSMWIHRLDADTIAVTDGSNRRIHIFLLDGTFVRSTRFDFDGYGSLSIQGRLEDGWLGWAPVGRGALSGAIGEIVETQWALLAISESGYEARRIATLDGRVRVVNDLGNGRAHYPFVPFSPEPVFASLRTEVLVSDGLDPSFARIGPDGVTSRIVRWATLRTRVADVWSRYTEASLEGMQPDRQVAYRRLFENDNLPIPEFVPAVSDIIVDALGNVWLERYKLSWETDGEWDVIGPDDSWLGTVITPPGVEVFEIGADYLLGKRTSSNDVEQIVIYGLSR